MRIRKKQKSPAAKQGVVCSEFGDVGWANASNCDDDSMWLNFLSSLNKDPPNDPVADADGSDSSESDLDFDLFDNVRGNSVAPSDDEIDSWEMHKPIIVSRRELTGLLKDVGAGSLYGEATLNPPLGTPSPQPQLSRPSTSRVLTPKLVSLRKRACASQERVGIPSTIIVKEHASTTIPKFRCIPGSSKPKLSKRTAKPDRKVRKKKLRVIKDQPLVTNEELQPNVLVHMPDYSADNFSGSDSLLRLNVCPVLSNFERLQLEEQMRRHVQLLTQVNLLCKCNLSYKTEELYTRQCLEDLQENHRYYGFHQGSAFNVWNLIESLKLTDEKNKPRRDQLVAPKPVGASKLHKRHRLRPPCRFVIEAIAHSACFLYPDLIPQCAAIAKLSEPPRFLLDSEDRLLALGYAQFFAFSNEFDCANLIHRHCLPHLPAQIIHVRLKALMKKPGLNLVKFVRKYGYAEEQPRLLEQFESSSIGIPLHFADADMPAWLKQYSRKVSGTSPPPFRKLIIDSRTPQLASPHAESPSLTINTIDASFSSCETPKPRVPRVGLQPILPRPTSPLLIAVEEKEEFVSNSSHRDHIVIDVKREEFEPEPAESVFSGIVSNQNGQMFHLQTRGNLRLYLIGLVRRALLNAQRMSSSSRPVVDGLIVSLLECLCDKTKTVQDGVVSSLVALGKRQTPLFITTMHAYLARNSKLPGSHRGAVLNVVNLVCSDKASEISYDQAALLVNLAVQEMTMSKDVLDVWQAPASDLLVTMSKCQCTSIMDSLLQKFQPGFTPHFYVVQSLGEIAINNPFGFIPFLSDILSRSVPMLPGLKTDSLKFVFAVALRKYCESIREYIANIAKAPDPTVKKEVYTHQIASAYDVLYLQWTKTKDVKVRGVVLECLGEMFHILSPEKLQDEVRKLLPLYLRSYGTQYDTLAVTQGLSRMLEAVIEQEAPLQPFLDEIWSSLFPLVGGPIDYSSIAAAKNQNEVLRCFHITAIKFSDKLMAFLLQRIANPSEKARCSALAVLRHLINSSGPYVDDKKSILLLGLKPVLSDPSVKVKQHLCQLIVALADHGYLVADGGQIMLEFLLKQICVYTSSSTASRKAADPELLNAMSLKSQCATTLQVLTSSVQDAEEVLWPYLFQFLCLEFYTPALCEICHSLALLAQRMNVENRFKLDLPPNDGKFCLHGADLALLPGPYQIFSRLFVALSNPSLRANCQSILQLLYELCPVFYPNLLKPVWDIAVPQLQAHLDESPDGSSCDEMDKAKEKKFENLLLKFLAKTLEAVNSEDWFCKIAAAMGQQFHLWNRYPDEKRFLFKAIGGVLMKITNRQFVLDHLDLMFRACNASVIQERQGCAIGVGYCASAHIDLVLTKLENEAKVEYQRRSAGFLGFIKDSIPMKTEGDIEIANLKAVIMLAFGYVTLYCPVNVVTQKLETVILRFLTSYFENPKDTVVKESLLSTIDLISNAVHPSHLNAEYVFEKRTQLLNYIKEYLRAESSEKLSNKVPLLAITAAASLVKLDHSLLESELWALCSVTAQQVFPLLHVKDDLPADSEASLNIESVLLCQDALFEEILRKQPSCPTLTILVKICQPWFVAEHPLIRQRAFDSTYLLLKAYYSFADVSLGQATDFTLLGGLLARLCPRLCDSSQFVRQRALNCVHWTLAVGALHLGQSKGERDSVVEGIVELSETLEKCDLHSHLSVISEIAKITNQRLFGSHLQTFISVLFDLLLDKQDGVSCAAASLLKHTFHERGPQLVAEAEKIVTILIGKLTEMQSVLTYAETLQAFFAFAVHHLVLIVNTLLGQPLPFSQPVCDCWHTLVRDNITAKLILDSLLDSLSTELPYELLDGSQFKYARMPSVSAIAALVELIKGCEPEDLILANFPRILAKMLLQCGALSGTTFARATAHVSPEMIRTKPSALVQTGIKSLLLRTRTDAIVNSLNEHSRWTDFTDELHYVDAVSEVARAIGAHYMHWSEPLIEHLRAYEDSTVPEHRVVCFACISEIVRSAPTDEHFVEQLMVSLKSGLVDSGLVARKLSIRGMGNFVHSSDAVFNRFTASILSALMAGLEDTSDSQEEVALEAMTGLAKVVTRVQAEQITKVLVNILLRVRACFEKDSAAVRTVAFSLFGQLAKFGTAELIGEQIHSSLITFLLHLNDDVPEVRKACSDTLNAIAPFMTEAPAIVEVFEKLGGSKLNYREFLNQCSKELAEAYADRVNFYIITAVNYFKSCSTRIKCNAALLIGYLMAAIPSTYRSHISADAVVSENRERFARSACELVLPFADRLCYGLATMQITRALRCSYEAPAYYFTKALSHKQKVCRLYKRALREVFHWHMPDLLETRYQKVMLRWRFDGNKDEKDMRVAKQMLLDGVRELWEKRHPQPFRYARDPGGVAWNRENKHPDSVLDYWHPREKARYPHYFAVREERKKELVAIWEKMQDEKEAEIRKLKSPV